GTVTAAYAGADTAGYQDLDPFNSAAKDAAAGNWFNQGADAGRYSNDDIHAIRILAMEPTTDRNKGPYAGRTFRSHASERLRILGEIPLRKFPQDPTPGPSPKGRGEKDGAAPPSEEGVAGGTQGSPSRTGKGVGGLGSS